MRIRVLGGLSAATPGGALTGEAAQPRRLALLALLAAARDRGVSRDRLTALVWPDADEERARRTLSQALYSIRKGFGADEVVLGTQDLRLNPAVVTTDLDEFETARREGDYTRAAELYAGPFLDGFHLPGSADFERWSEEFRGSLAHDHAEVLERLAERAEAAGAQADAVRWWRKLAGQDPLDARVAMALMRALAAAGDRTGALRHARVYQALVEQELDLPPDREVIALARELESAPAAPPRSVPLAQALYPEPAASEPVPELAPESAPAADPPLAGAEPAVGAPIRSSATAWSLAALAALVAVITVLFWPRREPEPAPGVAPPILVVGRIADYGGGEGLGRPLADLVATDLARTPTLRVLSTARVYELLGQLHLPDTAAAGFMSAARHAGATELLDGSLYDLGAGRIRLDLRRVDVGSGRVVGAYTVEGADAFALADSLTAQVARQLGLAAPNGLIAELTTSSAEAYRDYAAGLRDYFQGRRAEAELLFGRAVERDPQFAMARYYHALSATDGAVQLQRMDQALQRAARASDRERLVITATWALWNHSAAATAVAETLAVRYPAEVDGHLLLGAARFADEDFTGGIAELTRVVAMDSLALRGGSVRCAACDAYRDLVAGYTMVDSLPGALRTARGWTGAQPGNPTAWRVLAATADRAGIPNEADNAYRRAEAIDTSSAGRYGDQIQRLMLREQYQEAEEVNRARLAVVRDPAQRVDVLWDRMLIVQQEGRLGDALTAAAEVRRRTAEAGAAEREGHPAAIDLGIAEARALAASGRVVGAVARMDSLVHFASVSGPPSRRPAATLWAMTHLAVTLAMAGDTTRLRATADTMQVLARSSGYRRDEELPHYVLGLLYEARGDDRAALAELEAGSGRVIDAFAPPVVERARILVRQGRARDAIPLLQQALRGTFHFYLSHSEVHADLAEAWGAAGNADSARTHLAVLDREWAQADPPIRARLARLHSQLRL